MKKRNGYYYRNDKEYPSITKVLSEVLAKPALLYWYAKKATQIALKEPELNEKEVLAKLDLYVSSTQDRGKYIHSVCEAMPNVDDSKIKEEYKGYYIALKKWWDKEQPKPLFKEKEAISEQYCYGCRVDFVGEISNTIYLVDFKTQTGEGQVYKEVGLQLCAGKQALLEDNIVTIQKTAAVILLSTGEYLFKETNDSLDDLENVLKVWRWLKRKEG